MSHETEKLLSRINSGNAANLAYNELKPILDDLTKAKLAQIKQLYRSGTAEHLALLSIAAELVAYEDIESKLHGKINAGHRAGKELQGDK